MSAPRPFVTDPFHPLGSILNLKLFSYIYRSLPVISIMWCANVSRGRVSNLTIAHARLQKHSGHDSVGI